MVNKALKRMQDTTALGAQLANQKYMANQSLPNEYDVDADLFGEIQNQFSGYNGRGPRGIDALVSGLATGAKYGSKMKGLALRKEELEKFNRVMDYFSSVNAEAEKINQKNLKKEEVREQLMPYALASLEMAYSGQPYEVVNDKIKNLYEQAQLNDPSIKGKFIGYIPNTPLINVRDENGKNMVFSLSQITGEDGIRRIQGDWIDRQKMSMQERHFDQGLALQERGLGIQQQNADTSRMALEAKKAEEKAKSPEELEKETYLRLYDLLSSEDVDPTIGAGTKVKNWVAQNVPVVGGLVESGLAPQQEYQQLLADLKGLRFKKFGYRNQAEFNKIKTLEESLPKDQAKQFVANELKKLGIDVSNPSQQTIKVQDPSTGRIAVLSPDQAKVAEQRGGVVVP